MWETFYFTKSTDTNADLFLVDGAVEMLNLIKPVGVVLNPTVEDKGAYFQVELEVPFQKVWMDTQSAPPPINRFIQVESATALPCPPYVPNPVIYRVEKETNENWWKAIKDLSGKDRLPQNARSILKDMAQPNPHWSIWALINQQKAIKSYNKIVIIWHQHQGEAFSKLLHIIFDLFSTPFNDVEMSQRRWKELAAEYGIKADATETATQIINPGVGKGSHNSKMTGVKEGNLDNFWLLDYLRYAGMYAAGIPLTVQGGSDRKIYVPIPNKLTWGYTSKQIIQDYREAMMASTAIKMDILAIFRYALTFLRHWLNAQDSGGNEWDEKVSNPADHARAIAIVSLKDMGSSHAVMGMNELNIPEWVQVETPADGARFRDIIKEHQSVVVSLDEKHSDEHSLLRDYRRFLSTGELSTFLEFTRGFGGVTMSRLNEGNYAPQFTLPYLQEVLMAVRPDITPILQDSGFRAVAEAIRRSTVVPLFRQSRKQANLYDVRYGLGDKLMRASLDRNRFVRELTDFMFRYNQETAQVSASRKVQAFRSAITMEDVEAVAALIDTYKDCQLIAGLLVAYGYARDPEMGKHEKQDQTQGEE